MCIADLIVVKTDCLVAYSSELSLFVFVREVPFGDGLH